MYCLLCEEAPGVDDLGFCAQCRWIYRAEAEQGWWQLRIYLQKWARFRDWELAQAGARAPEA